MNERHTFTTCSPNCTEARTDSMKEKNMHDTGCGFIVGTGGSHRGCRHDYIEHRGSFIEGTAQREGGVSDVDSSGVARHEGRGVGVWQCEGGVGREGGGVDIAGESIRFIYQLLG